MTGNSSIFEAPEMLGQRWDCYAGTSAFGVLWRLSRLNNLRPNHLRTMLGLYLEPSDNLLEKLAQSVSRWDRLASASKAVAALDNTAWKFKPWLPLAGDIPTESFTQSLQICLICSKSCYHTLLFQLPGIYRCPWHGIRLTNRCPRCKGYLATDLRRAPVIGVCGCGHDLTTEIDMLDGDRVSQIEKTRIITNYLQDVARHRYQLHVPKGLYHLEREVIHALIYTCANREVRRFFSPPDTPHKSIHIERIGAPDGVHEDVERLADLLNSPEVHKQFPWPLCSLWSEPLSHMKRTVFQAAKDHGVYIPHWSFAKRPGQESFDWATYEISGYLHREVRTALDALPFPDKSYRHYFYREIRESREKTVRWYLMGHVYKRILLRGLAIASRYAASPGLESHPRLIYFPWFPWVALPDPDSADDPPAYIAWVRQTPRWRRNT